MRLTSYSNYSMRVLMVAAARGPRLTTIQEVADAFDISRAHLVKCVHHLGSRGYLETVRGNRGGFRLARPAAEIGVGAVMRDTEEGFSLVECFDPVSNTCRLIESCRLRVTLHRAAAAFLAVLDEVTLADLIADRAPILSLIDRHRAAVACSVADRAPVRRSDPV
jgi:Rrf2 family nitric oxide-sensitive transcriptional repressor